jgi:hypothetical protein
MVFMERRLSPQPDGKVARMAKAAGPPAVAALEARRRCRRLRTGTASRFTQSKLNPR